MQKELAQEYINQGKMLLSQEKYNEAITYFERAEDADKFNIEVYLQKGICYANLQELEKAENEFEKALKVNRQSGMAMFHLGNIALLKGERAKGLEYYNKAIANGYGDSQIYFTLGLFYEEEGNDDLALRNYSKAIHTDPMRPDARIRQIRILIKNGDAQQALQAIDEMLLACPDVFEGYHLRFLLLLQANKFQEAEETIDKAIEIFPQDVGFALDKASLLVAQKRSDEALAYLDKIEQTMDIDAADQRTIAMQKARIAAEANDMEKTIEFLEKARDISKAVDSNTLDTEAVYMLMNCYLSDGKLENAKECAELLKNEEGANQFTTPAAYYLPYILKQMGKEKEAEALYQEAVEKYRNLSLQNPGNLDFYVYRIMCLRDLQKYEKALELCDYLEAIQGDLSEVHTVKGIVLYAAGREEEAKEEQKKAEALGGVMVDLIKTAQA